jgi:hypothetical protein
VLVGVGGLAASRPARRSLVPWALVAVLVGCICWAPTVVDELGHHPGNLTRVVQVATERRATVGPLSAGTPSSGPSAFPGRGGRTSRARATTASTTCSRTRARAHGLGDRAARRPRRRRARRPRAPARGRDDRGGHRLVLCAALAIVAASTPTPRVMSATLGYTMWWAHRSACSCG